MTREEAIEGMPAMLAVGYKFSECGTCGDLFVLRPGNHDADEISAEVEHAMDGCSGSLAEKR